MSFYCITLPILEVGSVTLSDHHVEGKIETLIEGFLNLDHPCLVDLVGPPIEELPSTRYIDHFTRYRLPPH